MIIFFFLRWTLAGAVSAGTKEKCASKDSYGLASEIAVAVNFIKSVTNDGTYCANNDWIKTTTTTKMMYINL